MKLTHTTYEQQSDGQHKLSGFVEYDDGTADEIWFTCDYGWTLSGSGNPWLAILLPLASRLGEDLQISLPIDQQLFESSEELVSIWSNWYDNMSAVRVIANNIESASAKKTTAIGSASFFSSGVDSFFTALKFDRISHLLLVLGFDMPVRYEEAFTQHKKRIDGIAQQMDKTLISLSTNIRESRWQEVHWEAVGTGPSLACIALLLEDHFSEVFVPSSVSYSNLASLGTHPLVDPLFSTKALKIHHHGCTHSRFEKIEAISQFDITQKELHVCYRGSDGQGQDQHNCCRCNKCFRTMIALELCGKLSSAEKFSPNNLTADEIAKIYISDPIDISGLENLLVLAKERSATEIVLGINRALKRLKRINTVKKYEHLPLLWRLVQKYVRSEVGKSYF